MSNTPFGRVRYIPILNQYAGEIPPYGVCQITGYAKRGGTVYMTVTRPTGASSFDRYVINGPNPVRASTGRGIATAELPHFLLYDTADGSPTLGDSYGPQASSFKAKKNVSGYWVSMGAADDSGDLIYARQAAATASATPKIFMKTTSTCVGRDGTTGEMTSVAVSPLEKNGSDILDDDASPSSSTPSTLYNPTFHYWPTDLVVEAWQDIKGTWFGKPVWEWFDGINSAIYFPTATFNATALSLTANATETLTDFSFTNVSGELADVSSNKIRLKKPGKYRVLAQMTATCTLLSTYASHINLTYSIGGTSSKRMTVQDSRGNTTNTSEFQVIQDRIILANSADYQLNFQGAVSSPTWAGGMFDPRPNFNLNLQVDVIPMF